MVPAARGRCGCLSSATWAEQTFASAWLSAKNGTNGESLRIYYCSAEHLSSQNTLIIIKQGHQVFVSLDVFLFSLTVNHSCINCTIILQKMTCINLFYQKLDITNVCVLMSQSLLKLSINFRVFFPPFLIVTY